MVIALSASWRSPRVFAMDVALVALSSALDWDQPPAIPTMESPPLFVSFRCCWAVSPAFVQQVLMLVSPSPRSEPAVVSDDNGRSAGKRCMRPVSSPTGHVASVPVPASCQLAPSSGPRTAKAATRRRSCALGSSAKKKQNTHKQAWIIRSFAK